MIKDARRDLEILASADVLQADDRLLETTIKNALEQSNANWVEIIDFVIRVIGNRVPVVDGESNPQRILDSYHSLSPIVRVFIAQVFKLQVIPKATSEASIAISFPDNWQNTARWALCIFLDLNYADAPLLLLRVDTTVYNE